MTIGSTGTAARAAQPVLGYEAPWRWLEQGWSDLKANPTASLGLGGLATFGGLAIALLLNAYGWASLLPVAAGGFALVAPMIAVGFYAVSRARDAGEPARWTAIFAQPASGWSQIAFLGGVLLFAYIVWLRVAIMIFALFIQGDYPSLDAFASYVLTQTDGLLMVTVGTIAGGIIATAVFSSMAFAIPMMVDRKLDAVTGVIFSIIEVRKHFKVMALWAWLIALITAVSCLLAFIPLVVAFPLLGHASWRAYQDVMGEGDPT
ncbi:MAG: DUF2189 domain-containing protein [Maricaulaceae bacterium]